MIPAKMSLTHQRQITAWCWVCVEVQSMSSSRVWVGWGQYVQALGFWKAPLSQLLRWRFKLAFLARACGWHAVVWCWGRNGAGHMAGEAVLCSSAHTCAGDLGILCFLVFLTAVVKRDTGILPDVCSSWEDDFGIQARICGEVVARGSSAAILLLPSSV